MAESTHSHCGRLRAWASLALACSTIALTGTAAQARTPPIQAPIDIVDVRTSDTLLDACPIDGHATFEDSWGWARSGGRSHEGVDLIAERGTPIVAVRSGEATFKSNRLGGKAIWLETDDGDRFYYAHLDDWEGESRRVEAGELIGYVGSTGNAGGPHLHFETHPSNTVENPFGHTLSACVPSGEPDMAPATPVWVKFI